MRMIHKTVKSSKRLIFSFLIVFFMFDLHIAYAADPVATIISPQDNAVFLKSETINLTGSGTDIEDGNLSGPQLVWISNTDGPLGIGENISVFLSSGAHVITLRAIDSSDNAGTDIINIMIQGDK